MQMLCNATGRSNAGRFLRAGFRVFACPLLLLFWFSTLLSFITSADGELFRSRDRRPSSWPHLPAPSFTSRLAVSPGCGADGFGLRRAWQVRHLLLPAGRLVLGYAVSVGRSDLWGGSIVVER